MLLHASFHSALIRSKSAEKKTAIRKKNKMPGSLTYGIANLGKTEHWLNVSIL